MLLFRKKSGRAAGRTSRTGRTGRAAKRAETIIEVIMAIFIMATGSAAATSLIINSLTANSLSRDALIGLNLAVEGLEGMRNIRDSNWLKFGFNKELCWNMRPDEPACADGKLIKAGNYTLNLDTETMKWNLSTETTDTLNLSGVVTTSAQFQLYFKDLDPETDSDGNTDKTNDPDIYVSKDTADAGSATRFYRMVSVGPYTGSPAGDEISATSMTVSSLVQWKSGSLVHEVRLNTILTNYNKVKTS